MLNSKALFEKLDNLSEGKKRCLRKKVNTGAYADSIEMICLIGDQLQEVKDEEVSMIVLCTATAYVALDFKSDNTSFSAALGSCSLPTINRRYIDFLESFRREGFNEFTIDKFRALNTILRREGKTFDFKQFLEELLLYREDSEVKLKWTKDFVTQQNTMR